VPISLPIHFAPKDSCASGHKPDRIRPIVVACVERVSTLPIKLVLVDHASRCDVRLLVRRGANQSEFPEYEVFASLEQTQGA